VKEGMSDVVRVTVYVGTRSSFRANLIIFFPVKFPHEHGIYLPSLQISHIGNIFILKLVSEALRCQYDT
jgi:hypothetical protein